MPQTKEAISHAQAANNVLDYFAITKQINRMPIQY
jgi:hypothetical protein